MNCSEPILTVCIPTYNRIEILATVQAILPQLTNKVRIKIFDNASDTPVSEILSGFSTDSIEIVRNPVNVGLSGNIIKCFEYCQTEWMWLLSDDDSPSADAIKNILETIQKHSDIVYVKYDSSLGKSEDKYTTEVVSTGQKEFIHNLANFSNLLFISSTLCKPKEIRQGIKAAYYFAPSFAPHVALLLSYLAINPKAKTLFSPLEIVRWQMPVHNNTWSLGVVNKSVSDFVFAIQGTQERNMLFNKIIKYHAYDGPFASTDAKGMIRTMILAKGRKKEYDMIAEYFSSYSFMYWAKQSSTNKFLLKTVLMASVMLFLRAPIINSIAKVFIRNQVFDFQFYYNRFSFFNRDYRL